MVVPTRPLLWMERKKLTAAITTRIVSVTFSFIKPPCLLRLVIPAFAGSGLKLQVTGAGNDDRHH